MKLLQRTIVTALAATLATAGLAVVTAAPASAAVFTNVVISPAFGTDATLFGGSVTASCPAGTANSFWSLEGPAILVGTAFLGDGTNVQGLGPQAFTGASIANIKTNSAGSFLTNSTYRASFNCESAAGTTDTYVGVINYTAGGAGSYVFEPAAAPARTTTTVLTATPAGPFEAGTLTNLAAAVTPTTGANDAVGSVEFRNGAAVLGSDNTAPFTFANASLPVGTNNLTAVFTPAVAANFTGSTSNTVPVVVVTAAARLVRVPASNGPAGVAVRTVVVLRAGTAAGTKVQLPPPPAT